MNEQQKPKRPYHSQRRQVQARETRLQILEAAQKLFSEHGYSGATIEAIAQEAGVAPETIFAIFGNKRNILANLVDLMVGGDDQPVAILDRPGPRSVLQEQDPYLKIERFAVDIAGILRRVAPIFEIIRPAAKTEPDIAVLLKNILEERRRNLGLFVRNLSAHQPLRERMTADQATDTVWAITSPELYTLFTAGLGWSHAQYIQWLQDALSRLLLP